MADYRDIQNEVILLASYIDGRIEMMQQAASVTQEDIYKMLTDEILNFEIRNGSFVANQDFRKRLMLIQRKIENAISSKLYTGSIREFLTDFSNIQDKTVKLHKNSSQLELDVKELTPIRRHIYDQAKAALVDGNHPNFIEPVKQLLANQVLRGNSITDAYKALEQWNTGELSSGRLANGKPTPNLQRYATQIARDTAYSVQRNTNNLFVQKFGLSKFIYAGNIVADSRPICIYLVKLDRPIDINELPPLLIRFPQGLYPNTTKDNFCQVCGGYSCRHLAHSVKDDGIVYNTVENDLEATEESKWLPPVEVKNLADMNTVMNSFASRYPEYFERGFKQIISETNPRRNGATDMDGSVWISKTRLNSIYEALNSIKVGKPTSLAQEDALSTLLHEFTHNQNKVGNVRLTSKEVYSMELANEFVSRNNLDNFMTQLGGKLNNKDFMTSRTSTGYNNMVQNYQDLITHLEIDKSKVVDTVKKHLFEQSYKIQADGLISGLKDNYEGKKKYNFKQMVTKARDMNRDDFEEYLNNLGQ